MTKEKLAELLNGNEYGKEITNLEVLVALDSGLVVVFGYSDDNTEFCGAISDEVGCFDGGTIFVTPLRVWIDYEHRNCDCKFCGFNDAVASAKTIEALWCKEEPYSWTYKTDIPHATFDILEDGEPFCRGIVFDVIDL